MCAISVYTPCTVSIRPEGGGRAYPHTWWASLRKLFLESTTWLCYHPLVQQQNGSMRYVKNRNYTLWGADKKRLGLVNMIVVKGRGICGRQASQCTSMGSSCMSRPVSHRFVYRSFYAQCSKEDMGQWECENVRNVRNVRIEIMRTMASS